MKKVMLIGKLNENLKEINTFLSAHFHVQLSSLSPAVLYGMLEVFTPDAMVISLVGAQETDSSIFGQISSNYPDIPVITIGTEYERDKFLRFYSGGQFENIIRPTSSQRILEALESRLSDEAGDGEPVPEPEPLKTVMIVDDDVSVLRSVKLMLEKDFGVVVAPSGTKAMTLIGKKRPDVILLDYEMPVCDGRQTLEMIRSDDEIKDIPVIFLTGVNDREHIKNVLNLKPAGYLLKPADPLRLRETISAALKIGADA